MLLEGTSRTIIRIVAIGDGQKKKEFILKECGGIKKEILTRLSSELSFVLACNFVRVKKHEHEIKCTYCK